MDFTLDHNNYKVLAVLSAESSENHLPTGLKKWKLMESECGEEMDLKFTVVSGRLILSNLNKVKCNSTL